MFPSLTVAEVLKTCLFQNASQDAQVSRKWTLTRNTKYQETHDKISSANRAAR